MKACYTLSINAKTGGKAVGRREYDNTKYGLCASLKANKWIVSFLYHDEPVCLELCRDYLPKCYLKTVAEWTVEDYLEKRRFDEICQSMS